MVCMEAKHLVKIEIFEKHNVVIFCVLIFFGKLRIPISRPLGIWKWKKYTHNVQFATNFVACLIFFEHTVNLRSQGQYLKIADLLPIFTVFNTSSESGSLTSNPQKTEYMSKHIMKVYGHKKSSHNRCWPTRWYFFMCFFLFWRKWS